MEDKVANFEFPAWRHQIFSTESQIPGKQIRHLFWIHLGNPFSITILNILDMEQKVELFERLNW